MQAFDDENEKAVAICSNCGKALSRKSCVITETQKIVCSDECKEAVIKFDKTINIIYAKTLKQNKTSAYGMFLASTIVLVFGLYYVFFKYVGLGIYCIAIAIGIFIWGILQYKVGAQSNSSLEKATGKR